MSLKHLAPLFEIKTLNDNGTFAGYGSIFGNRDAQDEIVVPGAFKKSLEAWARRNARPKLLWMHDPSTPIGSWTNVVEDQKGLYVEGRLNMKVQAAREAYALLKEGDIDGLSIGYRTVVSERDAGADVVYLKEIDLFEISVVTFPANEVSVVDTVKSRQDLREAFASGQTPRLKSIEEYLRDGGFPDGLAASFVSLGKDAFLRKDSGVEANSEAERFYSELLKP